MSSSDFFFISLPPNLSCFLVSIPNFLYFLFLRRPKSLEPSFSTLRQPFCFPVRSPVNQRFSAYDAFTLLTPSTLALPPSHFVVFRIESFLPPSRTKYSEFPRPEDPPLQITAPRSGDFLLVVTAGTSQAPLFLYPSWRFPSPFFSYPNFA